MSKRRRLARSHATDVAGMPVSVNGEDIVFHEVVSLSPARLEKKEQTNGASPADRKLRNE